MTRGPCCQWRLSGIARWGVLVSQRYAGDGHQHVADGRDKPGRIDRVHFEALVVNPYVHHIGRESQVGSDTDGLEDRRNFHGHRQQGNGKQNEADGNRGREVQVHRMTQLLQDRLAMMGQFDRVGEEKRHEDRHRQDHQGSFGNIGYAQADPGFLSGDGEAGQTHRTVGAPGDAGSLATPGPTPSGFR